MRTVAVVVSLLGACSARATPAAPPEVPVTLPPTSRGSVEQVMPITSATPRFSADGAHALGGIEADGAKLLLLDGREVARGTQPFVHTAIGADGSWVTYLSGEPLSYEEEQKTGKPARNLLVHRGVTTEIEGAPSGLAVTADGGHVLYAADLWLRDDGVLVRDGQRVGGGFAMRLVTLSPDGTRWAVATSVDRHGSGELVTVDGVKGKRYASVWGLSFSPDGRHLAYKALLLGSTNAVLVVDGQESAPYQQVDASLQFTTDGRVVAVVTREGTPWVRVGDSETRCGHPCEVRVAGNAVAWIAELDEAEHHTSVAFLDGVEVFRRADAPHGGGDYGPSITSLALAPDGSRLAFSTQGGVHVVDRGGGVQVLGGGEPLAFDETGDQLAVWVREPGGMGLDRLRVGDPAGAITGPRLGRDARAFAETVRFVDGEVHLFARDEGHLVRVRMPTGP